MTPELARAITAALPIGGEVFLVSDVRSLAAEMRQLFLEAGCVPRAHGHEAAEASADTGDGWVDFRPYDVPTERDLVCDHLWRKAYRAWLVKV